TVRVLPPVATTPLVRSRVPPTVALTLRVLMPPPVIARSWKLVPREPSMGWLAPASVTVLVLDVNVPLLTQSPYTVSVFEPLMVSEAPLLIVMSRQTAPAASMSGKLGTPAGMMTSVVDVGMAPHQLAGTNQSSLATPIQFSPS